MVLQPEQGSSLMGLLVKSHRSNKAKLFALPLTYVFQWFHLFRAVRMDLIGCTLPKNTGLQPGPCLLYNMFQLEFAQGFSCHTEQLIAFPKE